MLEASTPEATADRGTTHLTIAMCGPNVVIRSSGEIDQGYTDALVDAVNAAAATDTVVIIDPEPVHCDDAFATDVRATPATPCARHERCEPVEASVVNSRMIRIDAEHDSWTIDVSGGRFFQAAPTTHHLYVSPDAWVPVVAIIVTRGRLSALTTHGGLISSSRAHRAA